MSKAAVGIPDLKGYAAGVSGATSSASARARPEASESPGKQLVYWTSKFLDAQNVDLLNRQNCSHPSVADRWRGGLVG